MGIIHLETKRYTLQNSNFGTAEAPNGQYVMFTDYQALWDELTAVKKELFEAECKDNNSKIQQKKLVEFTDALIDGWDDLLEDLEMHGMHKFEPYVRSKEKMRVIYADGLPQALVDFYDEQKSQPFPCFKCGADLLSQSRNTFEDGIICTSCKLTSNLVGPYANTKEHCEEPAYPIEADE